MDSEGMGLTPRDSIKEGQFTASREFGMRSGMDKETEELDSFYDPREMLEEKYPSQIGSELKTTMNPEVISQTFAPKNNNSNFKIKKSLPFGISDHTSGGFNMQENLKSL